MADIKATGRGGDGYRVNEITLDQADIDAKQIQLPETPRANSVIVDIPCGTVQISVLDYVVSGDIIDWDSRGMETILSPGDKLIVSYALE